MEAWDSIFVMDEYKWTQDIIEKKDKTWYDMWLESIDEYKK